MASTPLQAPFIGVVRHRLATDGEGVTTLAAFHGCPLRCRYCLNDQCHWPEGVWRTLTPEQLFQMVAIDNLYFQATGGGVTFGGGEPMLHSEFIEAFCKIMVPQWAVNVETSLYVSRHHLERLLPHITSYCIDIKDTNPDIYKRYARADVKLVLDNLQWLLSHEGLADRIIVRLPIIPHYNTADDVARSRETLTQMGVKHFDEFTYNMIKTKPIEGE